VDLTFETLKGLTADAQSDAAPGSKGWVREGSATQRINDALVDALRANGGTAPGELAVVPLLVLTATGARSGVERMPIFQGAPEAEPAGGEQGRHRSHERRPPRTLRLMSSSPGLDSGSPVTQGRGAP
jgi:hypothetical protein